MLIGPSAQSSRTEHYKTRVYGSISPIASLRMAALEVTEAYRIPDQLLWGAVGGFLMGSAAWWVLQ
ncbi:hypothetical protein B9Z19DRAFT_1089343 [Tuber borchii]|uniref:Uncharacterized protein n=1 Tax=Tuber borchii TaxID=42251 RepID=A0A2T6ZKA8_TUBBO|nr:hypothetical protein B9Z19DRAFT_1089343 [Tuber borchii]